MPECDDPVTDTGRKNSVPLCDPAQACPVGIPDNTAGVSWVNGQPVFTLGAGVGTVPGGGDNCPPVPAPSISFVTGAENVGEGEGLFSQLVSGVLQFLSLQFGSGFTVTNNGTSLLIELIDSGVVSWDDILSKPAEFPPSAHTHTLADITDAGSAAGADSTDFEAAGAVAALAGALGAMAFEADDPSDGSEYVRKNNTWAVATTGGAGTVTNTGGDLTANAVVLGAGGADAKVVAGVTTNGTAQLVLGVNTTTLGSVKMFGNTSGDVTLSPNAVAGTAIALTLPATSGTMALTSDVSVVPSNPQSAAYPLVLADAGKSIDHPSTDANARTFTIPANTSVAYPVGTTISFSNMTAQVVTIAITDDTMYLAGAGTTGSRSLAQYGVATARKITSTAWLIVGTGLT